MERAASRAFRGAGKRRRQRARPDRCGCGRSRADSAQPAPGREAAARQALDRAAAEIEAIAARLRDSGQDEEAEIVETGTLIAKDPSLHREVLAAVFEAGLPAAAAILDVSEAQAELVAALDDARLAETSRRHPQRRAPRRRPGRRGFGPAAQRRSQWQRRDPGRLGSRPGRGRGAGSRHRRDRPRRRGRLGPCGDRGPIAGHPDGRRSRATICSRSLPEARWWWMEAAEPSFSRRTPTGSRLPGSRSAGGPTDAHRPSPVASFLPSPATATRFASWQTSRERAELSAALEAGAEGVGLLRTELAFLAAPAWPSEEDHRRELAPVLALLQGRVATVRVLDFGADKTPPFLAAVEERGIELLLDHPGPFAAQLRAIVATAGSAELRILLPMVGTLDQVHLAKDAILHALDSVPGALSSSDRSDDRDRRGSRCRRLDRGRGRFSQHRDQRPHPLDPAFGPILAPGVGNPPSPRAARNCDRGARPRRQQLCRSRSAVRRPRIRSPHLF